MSSKKDNYYLNLALDLAKDREGLTGSNPSVGAIIVKNGLIISQGQTGFGGRPHAEFNAINSCKANELKDPLCTLRLNLVLIMEKLLLVQIT